MVSSSFMSTIIKSAIVWKTLKLALKVYLCGACVFGVGHTYNTVKALELGKNDTSFFQKTFKEKGEHIVCSSVVYGTLFIGGTIFSLKWPKHAKDIIKEVCRNEHE